MAVAHLALIAEYFHSLWLSGTRFACQAVLRWIKLLKGFPWISLLCYFDSTTEDFYLNFIQFYFDSWIAEIISTTFQCCPLLTFCLTHMSSGGHPPHGLLWSCVCLHGVSASWCCFVFRWLSFACRLLLSREFLMCYNHSYSPLPPVWACAQFDFRYFPCFCFFCKHQRA